MWDAIKSDLADFVSTVKDDTTKTLNHVLGEEDEEEDETYIVQNKLIANLRRSFETYSTPVNEKKSREFERYLDSFTLTEFASDIASVLDEEPEVSRFYAELVPARVTPEEFWARLFFRVKLVYRHSEHEEEDDEEDLVWDEGETSQPAGGGADSVCSFEHSESNGASARSAATATDGNAHNNSGGVAKINSQMSKRINELEDENSTLKGQVKTLVGRVAQLEQELKALRAVGAVSSSSSSSSIRGDEQQQERHNGDGNSTTASTQEAGCHDNGNNDNDNNGDGNGDDADEDADKSPVSFHSSSSSSSSSNNDNINNNQSHTSPVAFAENASMSSETSGVLVSAGGDLSSCDGDAAAAKAPSATIQATTTTYAARAASESGDKAKFLAALDDDEEDDGWS